MAGTFVGVLIIAVGFNGLAIFGAPMETWRTRMPMGMALKSDGFASNLYDPGGAFALREYCTAEGLDYADLGMPIAREVFADYGVEFQRRFVSSFIFSGIK